MNIKCLFKHDYEVISSIPHSIDVINCGGFETRLRITKNVNWDSADGIIELRRCERCGKELGLLITENKKRKVNPEIIKEYYAKL